MEKNIGVYEFRTSLEDRRKNMAYIKNKNGFKIGDWAITTKKIDSCAGYFEKGTKVKVIGKSYRGYDLEDEYGNRVIETGYDSIG